MRASDPAASAVSIGRKPRDDEIDVYGVTHPGKVRRENQDHFLISSLHKRMQVHLTSLPTSDLLWQDTERLAFVAMVADGVGGAAAGGKARPAGGAPAPRPRAPAGNLVLLCCPPRREALSRAPRGAGA